MDSALLYGLMAEFSDEETLMEATRKVNEAGYTRIDAFTPFPVEGLAEMLGVRGTRLPLIVLGGGILGLITGFGMQYYATVIAFPLNIGGRPLDSWPAYIPITFELVILFAAFAATLGMFALNGLPHPYHPVFNVERFAQASRNRFFLIIEASDPLFDAEVTHTFLDSLNGMDVFEVER